MSRETAELIAWLVIRSTVTLHGTKRTVNFAFRNSNFGISFSGSNEINGINELNVIEFFVI